ncbi:MAG: Txe/YoeB family addiction module toxin [Thiomargarita sp.]|nr:Txe/YoeB family addiction module toxin [Thiomargarita sp.]
MLTAQVDIEYWKQHNDKKYQKLKKLIEQVLEAPITGIGKPEALKHKLSGIWSRKIDQKNRLVYSFDNEYLYIWQARFHYVEDVLVKKRDDL